MGDGEEAGIVIREEDGDTKELGILKPGECFTVRLKGFVGLYAQVVAGHIPRLRAHRARVVLTFMFA